MKRLIAVLLILGLAQACGLAQTNVPGKNAVGYVTLTVPAAGKFNLAGANFRQVGGGTLKLSELLGTDQLIQHATFPGRADRIAIWNHEDQEYFFCFQKPDGRFYEQVSPFTNRVDPEIESGEAFWIIAPPLGAVHKVTMLGEVQAADSITLDVLGGPAITQIASPFSTPLILDGPKWFAAGAVAGTFPGRADRIFTWDEAFNGGQYRVFFLRQSDKQWVSQTNLSGPAEYPGPRIKIGEGAWIVRPVIGGGNPFSITMDRPYTYPVDQ